MAAIKFDTVSRLFAMKWWDQMPWSSFSECLALCQLSHSPLPLSCSLRMVFIAWVFCFHLCFLWFMLGLIVNIFLCCKTSKTKCIDKRKCKITWLQGSCILYIIIWEEKYSRIRWIFVALLKTSWWECKLVQSPSAWQELVLFYNQVIIPCMYLLFFIHPSTEVVSIFWQL